MDPGVCDRDINSGYRGAKQEIKMCKEDRLSQAWALPRAAFSSPSFGKQFSISTGRKQLQDNGKVRGAP